MKINHFLPAKKVPQTHFMTNATAKTRTTYTNMGLTLTSGLRPCGRQEYMHTILLIFVSDPTSAFAIYGYSPTYNSSSRVAVFPSTSLRLNIGNHYSTSTGKFTCYYPGVYVFSLNLYKRSGASRVYCYIRKNGSDVALAEVPSESEIGIYESSASTILHLNRGDTVNVGSCYNADGIHWFTSFTGFLLKAD